MKNITITLDEEAAHWARIQAAEKNTSVSRLVGDLIREKMLDEEKYISAMELYISQKPEKLKKNGIKYPSRNELYDR